jgi:prepilin-type N-terminal cleavage/methylation domain-containing protein
MNAISRSRSQGFSLIEIMISLALTLMVMAAVFALLHRGQRSFEREPQVADMQQNARAGLDRINRDLLMAGYKTPPAMAVLWADGGGNTPDSITIVFADPDVPTSSPLSGPAGSTIESSSTLFLDASTLDPAPGDPSDSYPQGMTLMAIETEDCNGDGQIGFHLFETTQDSQCTSAGGPGGGPGGGGPPGGGGGGGCDTLMVNHNPSSTSGLNAPGGFNGSVQADCAIIGFFRMVQYRINPPPPAANPSLERRDLSVNEPWNPVANNVENLQFRYLIANSPLEVDAPAAAPDPADPLTWIVGVNPTVLARTQSVDLEGASQGVFAAEDTHVRTAFSTSVSLRNVAATESRIEVP